MARATGQIKASQLHLFSTIEDTLNQIDTALKNPPTSNQAAYYAKKNMRERQVEPMQKLLTNKKSVFEAAGMIESWAVYVAAFAAMAEACRGDGSIDALANDTVRTELQTAHGRLAQDRSALKVDEAAPVGVDSPIHFDFDEFVSTTFVEVLSREAERNHSLRQYVGTLQLRLEQARQDPRYAFLFRARPFGQALASFLRLIFGLDPSRHFETSPPPWKDTYREQYSEVTATHQITILDLSQLASEVLENVTALIGRLVLEFMQRNPDRGKFPVVLILEEAHHYIPANARLERQQRAREVSRRLPRRDGSSD